MKTYINKNWLLAIMLSALGAMGIVSCEEDESGAAPVLERVSLVPKDSTTHEGGRGETLVIFGQNLKTTQEVYFSGVKAALNTTMVRNDNIIITIPGSAPFPGPNVLSTVRVVTLYGEANLEFEVAQPDPDIESFAPAVAGAGELVTIQGSFFNGLQNVSFVDVATGTPLEAEVISVTINDDETGEIVVEVPVGVKVSQIAVTTSAGTGLTVGTFGFNYAVFTDDIAGDGWAKAGWSSTTSWDNTTPVKSGNFSAKHAYTGGWGGFQLRNDNASGFVLADYEAVKVSIFGGPGTEGKLVQIYIKQEIDGEFPAKELVVHEGKWTDYTVTLEELGNPSYVKELVIQDKGMAPYIIYVDDVGFL